LQELLELTGAAEVVYRTSWSSQNNALLLGKLIYLIQLNRDVIELPWPHMSIVYSKEESEHRINYLDREIILDPSDVPEQVLTILQMIRVGALFEAQVHVDQIARLQESFENAASAIIHTAMRSGTALHPPAYRRHTRCVKWGIRSIHSSVTLLRKFLPLPMFINI
jgi:hypothetical protein